MKSTPPFTPRATPPSTPPAAKKGKHLPPRSTASLLTQASLKRTRPRQALLDALTSNHGPYSIEELHELVAGDGMDLVTVYRCISAFEKAGIVRRCEFGDGVSRYEFGSEELHHHHIVCRACRKTQNIEKCIPPALVAEVERLGYAQVTHSLEFFGECRSCQKATQKAK